MRVIQYLAVLQLLCGESITDLFLCPPTHFRCPYQRGCKDTKYGCDDNYCRDNKDFLNCSISILSERLSQYDHNKNPQYDDTGMLCQRERSEPSGIISFLGTEKIFCQWVITTVNDNIILLEVLDIVTKDEQPCLRDKLQIYDSNWILLNTYCQWPHEGSVLSRSVGNRISVHFQSTIQTRKQLKGFNASFVTKENTWCVGTMTVDRIGVIQIPKHATNTVYNDGSVTLHHAGGSTVNDDDIDCTWILNALNDNIIRLWFVDMNASDVNNTECDHHYLQILDGNFLTEILCGAEYPKKLESSTNVLTIILHSKSTSKLHGFSIVYQQVSFHRANVLGNDVVLTNPAGLIQSYGLNYFIWVVVAPNEKRIVFEFQKLVTDVYCDEVTFMRSYIELYDGWFKYTESLGRYCKIGIDSADHSPRTRVTKTNVLYVEFVSNSLGSRWTEFEAVYNMKDPNKCERFVNDIAGSFHTDGQEFGGYNDCTWRIEVPTSYRRIELIIFYFNDDDVQLAECKAGCVQIYDGVQDYGVLYGTNSSLTVKSGSNFLYVSFVRNNEVTARRLSAFYTTVGVYRVIGLSTSNTKTVPPRSLMTISSTPLQTLTSKNEPRTTSTQYKGRSNGTHDKQTGKLNGCGGHLMALTDRNELYSIFTNTSYETEIHCVWLITAPVGMGVRLDFLQIDTLVSWTDYRNPTESLRSSTVITLHDGSFNKTRNPVINYILPPPTMTKSNVLFIEVDFGKTYIGNGFKATFKQYGDDDLCGPVQSRLAGIVASIDNNGDGFYDDNFACIWEIRPLKTNIEAIEFFFLTLNMEYSEDCNKDFVRVFGEIGMDVLCEPLDFPSKTFGAVMFVEFVSDNSINDEGFTLVYSASQNRGMSYVRQNCGGIYKAGYHYRYFSLEEIYSYDANMDCVWVLVAPERWLIKVSFSHICIEWEPNCNYDFLEIYDGSYDSVAMVIRICGKVAPKPLYSATNILYLVFHSDDSVECSGFIIEYTANDERRCDVDHISHTSVIAGSFQSVDRDYDGYYDHNIHCFWELKLASFKTNEVIEIGLYDVDIPSNDNCSSDHIKVYDNYATYGVYCGSFDSAVITSSSTPLYVAFTTDGSKAGKGFTVYYTHVDSPFSLTTARYKAVSPIIMTTLSMYISGSTCGGILTSPSGIIKSVDKNFDGRYDNDLHCVWIILAPPGLKIQFGFIEFQLFKGCNDFITLHDGQFNEYIYFATRPTTDNVKCNTSSSSPMLTTTSVLFVEFVTDDTWATRGFRAKYRFQEAPSTGSTKSPDILTTLPSSDRTTELSASPYSTSSEHNYPAESSSTSLTTVYTTAVYTFLTTFTSMFSTQSYLTDETARKTTQSAEETIMKYTRSTSSSIGTPMIQETAADTNLTYLNSEPTQSLRTQDASGKPNNTNDTNTKMEVATTNISPTATHESSDEASGMNCLLSELYFIHVCLVTLFCYM